jgi:deoxyribodipyrimidine photolyase-related protein
VPTRHLLILPDQLHPGLGPLADAEPSQTVVLLCEDHGWMRSTRAHKQKLVLFFAAQRRFAQALTTRGFTVHHLQKAASLEWAIAQHLAAYPGAHLELSEPNDRSLRSQVARAVQAGGGTLKLHPNAWRLVDHEVFDRWAAGRKRLRMEDFYRQARQREGWLLDPESPSNPLGGKWNFDHDNRKVPPPGTRFTPPLAFEPDALVQAVIDEVDADFANHPGTVRAFAWPTSRSQALELLAAFVRDHLPTFGPYEDAMLAEERTLHHSRLSAPINLGLLHPREVVEAALAAFHADPARIPLASIEGFVRQVLGWREYMFHIDRTRGAQLEASNALGHHHSVPEAFWTGETRMACLHSSWQGLAESGYNHHIERLMIFGNLALSHAVDPLQLTAWFTGMYVDAFDWVMVPNVMGMSQYADGGGFTSKPYVSGGAYINRMSDHCARCPFDPGARTGERACPFTVGYWDFIDRHAKRFERHPRMAVVVKAWQARDEHEKAAVRALAASYRERLP